MSFSPVGATPTNATYYKTLSFDLESMLQKAEDYAKGDSHLLEYIKIILVADKFQSNPKGYLKDWREKRGRTEEYRWPEDRARGFFDANFRF